jgi:uncharacterized protein (DUF2062 family)
MYQLKILLKEQVIGKLLKFLQQGVSPYKLALGLALGIVIGVFPLIGTHTFLTFLAIYFFRLNPASILLVTNLVFPLFFLCIIPFLQVGEFVLQTNRSNLSMDMIYKLADTGIISTIKTLGSILLYAVVGWMTVCIPLSFLIYYSILSPMKHLEKVINKK